MNEKMKARIEEIKRREEQIRAYAEVQIEDLDEVEQMDDMLSIEIRFESISNLASDSGYYVSNVRKTYDEFEIEE